MRTILITAAVAGALVSLAACGGGAESEGGGPRAGGTRDVVAAFYPVAFAAEQVAPDVDVANLTPAGAEPHDLELSVRDVQRVRDADLVLLFGGGFQPAVEEAAAATSGTVVDLLGELRVEVEDPHVWLDPELYGRLAERIAAELGDAADADSFRERLRELESDFDAGLAECERREIVVSHAAFGYLAGRYGLEQIPLAGLAPEAEPSAQDLRKAARIVQERGIDTVFVEPLAPPDEAEAIARETGAQTATLNPIEGLTAAEEERGEDYFSLMRANLEALRAALRCR